jgi:hypothetical protein
VRGKDLEESLAVNEGFGEQFVLVAILLENVGQGLALDLLLDLPLLFGLRFLLLLDHELDTLFDGHLALFGFDLQELLHHVILEDVRELEELSEVLQLLGLRRRPLIDELLRFIFGHGSHVELHSAALVFLSDHSAML